ncbi:unnamed protein product [Schistocephalus solidus]|uniref:Uncharacterized protein n=1 Tax=Schistocephalus solidus TaxID=70667 RepID=A0A183T721_SCHSO|nr:unnamed protein product [Schistocephalus solidus]
MLLWPPLTGTQLSPVAPRSWVLPSGHTPGNRNDRRAQPGEVSCVVCASIPGMSDSRTSHLTPLKKSYGGGDSNPVDSPTLTPGINSITPTILETTALYSSPVTPTTANTTTFAFTTTTISDGDSLLNCP